MKNILFTLIIISSISACEDFFTTTLDAEPPKFEEKLVANLEIIIGESQIACEVSQNQSSFEVQNSLANIYISNATVSLFKNNTFEAALIKDTTTGLRFNYKAILDNPINLGDIYTLEVSHPNFDKIVGQSIVLSPVEIKRITYSKNKKKDIFDNEITQYKFNVEIENENSKDHYYEVNLLQRQSSGTNTYYSKRFIKTESHPEYKKTDYGHGFVLNDKLFNDGDNIITFDFEDHGEQIDISDFFIQIKSITSDFYKYKSTFSASSEGGENPFSTPIQVYSNMKNGLGIFAISNKVVVPVE